MSHSGTVDEWRGRERALTALGVDVHLIAAQRWHAGGAPVQLTPREGEQVVGAGTLGRHPALFLFDPRPLWRALGERWDVIDVHEEPFALATAEVRLLRALRRNRAPFVLYSAQNIAKRYPIPFRWLERGALRAASGISVCNAEAGRISVAKGFAGEPRMIPLGVDLARYAPSAPNDPHTPQGRADAVTVGLLGRLVEEKGVGVLFEAARLDERLRVRIAGSGPLAAELETRAHALGIADRVEVLGALATDEVPSFYHAIDVLAVPSIATASWTEQFGRVAIEAMASGVPVVSSDAGALPDVVADAGIVVPAGDAAALAEALITAAGPAAVRLREAGFTRASTCSWDAVAQEYLGLYRSTLRSAPTPSAAEGVEIIVVAYGSPDLLRRCLEPVAHLAVTVVDNSSLPEIAAMCAELGVRYIESGANLGFGAAVNLALADRLRPGADVLLLNPDARIDPARIDQLHTALRAESDVASVGPAQVDEAGRTARVEWPFPSPGGAWLEAIGLNRMRRQTGFVIGSVLLLRADALAQVGGFDESFFLYAEETDWAYRAHRLGWRHLAVPSVHAVHHGAGTSTDARRREAHFHASQERYFRKHFGAAGWQTARVAIWGGSFARGLVLRGERGTAARRRAALYRAGPVRREALLRTVR
ncbi:glycosyltransferase [Microbacterium lacus]|uniref:glycosyltransferase n=1 Tax=Microbacterium lacus TaxID=415217 RepID=UPI00384EB06B